ncbi:MAG: TIGR02147 family protein [Fibrobacter sp.]|nr:TIGR02147 family protein [Fibrobacter sp.]
MLSIFEFIDFRKYLADYYQFKKETSQYFSYRYFARKIGINSPSFLKNVIDGKRNLTRQMAERFCKALGLSDKEKLYFHNLVLFNQAKTSGEKQVHYTVLRSISDGVKEAVLNTDKFDYFSNWYTPVIRELICLYDFKDDYRLMASVLKPKIRMVDAKNAVDLLLRLKLIERKDDGGFCQTPEAVIADDSVTSLAIRSFTHKMIEHSRFALDTIDKNQRNISGVTMSISSEAYKMITSEITAFKDRVKFIVSHDDACNRVYQLNISLFPVSEEVDKIDKGNAGEI